MASKTAILAVRIIGDATSATKALAGVDESAGRMSAGVEKAGRAANLALAGIGAAALAAGNVAAEAEQQVGAVDAVFGMYSDRMHGYANDAARTLGLSTQDYGAMASMVGSQLKNMGISLDEAADKTNWMIGLGADLSAQFGGSTSDAVAALSSLLRGERDPIERYGVSIKQADVDAQKAAMGLSDLTGEAAKNADLQATLAILTRQTADAQGAFGRETDTASHKNQVMQATVEDASAKLGTAFLPALSEGADLLAKFAEWAGQNTGIVYGLAGAIAIIAAGVSAFTTVAKIYAAAQAIATAAQWANNAAWLASPVTWIVLAIVAAIGLVVLAGIALRDNWDEIGAGAADVWGSIVGWIKDAWKWITDLFSLGAPAWLGGGGVFSVAAASTSSASSGTSGFAAPVTRMASFAAFTAPVAPLTAPSTAGLISAPLATADSRPPAGDTYNVTVNGALDPVAVSRQIGGLIDAQRKRTGAAPAGGRGRTLG